MQFKLIIWDVILAHQNRWVFAILFGFSCLTYSGENLLWKYGRNMFKNRYSYLFSPKSNSKHLRDTLDYLYLKVWGVLELGCYCWMRPILLWSHWCRFETRSRNSLFRWVRWSKVHLTHPKQNQGYILSSGVETCNWLQRGPCSGSPPTGSWR